MQFRDVLLRTLLYSPHDRIGGFSGVSQIALAQTLRGWRARHVHLAHLLGSCSHNKEGASLCRAASVSTLSGNGMCQLKALIAVNSSLSDSYLAV